jgi:hypothetical protein
VGGRERSKVRLTPEDAAAAVLRTIAERDDDLTNSVVNVGQHVQPPVGMKVDWLAGHPLVSLRELAYFALHGEPKGGGR